MIVLFLLYGSPNSNSSMHVAGLAGQLSQMGVECILATPENIVGSLAGEIESHCVVNYSMARKMLPVLRIKDSDLIVHAWTPREIIRKFWDESVHGSEPLIIHLEDNEDILIERIFNKPFESPLRSLMGAVPESMSHPKRYRDFIRSAQGITVIVEKLAEHVPKGMPWIRLWPGVDTDKFSDRFEKHQERKRLGFERDNLILVYTGNVHEANVHEVCEVYKSVILLREEGLPAYLLRTGIDFLSPSPGDVELVTDYVIHLGHVPHEQMPEILACGDLLVQPGKPDEFNNYRFPSKLPEYLAMGKPIILPRANIGNHLTNMEEAIVKDHVDARAIADAAKLVYSDPSLAERLGRGARTFAERELRWEDRANKLLDFYDNILSS